MKNREIIKKIDETIEAYRGPVYKPHKAKEKLYPKDGPRMIRIKLIGKTKAVPVDYLSNDRKAMRAQQRRMSLIYLGKGRVYTIGGVKVEKPDIVHCWRLPSRPDDLEQFNKDFTSVFQYH